MKQRILFVTVIWFCFSLVFGAEARQQKKEQVRKQDTTQKTDTRNNSESKKQIADRNVIPEAATLVQHTDSRFTGTFSFKSDASNCNAFNYSGKITPVGQSRLYDAFYFERTYIPGVKHEFFGEICFPQKDAKFSYKMNFEQSFESMKYSFADGATIRIGDGFRSISGGWVSLGGGGIINQYSGPVFRIQGDPENPLTLELTLEGYKFVSGKGRVTTPSGKVYVFPE